MGSNMMRQSVPLLQPEAPVVGTGVEYRAAFDSQQVVVALAAGTVGVTSPRSVERDEGNERDTYVLKKFPRPTRRLHFNQRRSSTSATGWPRPGAGRLVEHRSGRDGAGPEHLVAFLPWEGGNYEDAIVISERASREDLFTSIHIEKHEIEARDTRSARGDHPRHPERRRGEPPQPGRGRDHLRGRRSDAGDIRSARSRPRARPS